MWQKTGFSFQDSQSNSAVSCKVTDYPGINKAGFGCRWLWNIYGSGFGKLIQVLNLKTGVKNVFLILLTFPTYLKLCRSAIKYWYLLFVEKSRIQVSFFGKTRNNRSIQLPVPALSRQKIRVYSTGCWPPSSFLYTYRGQVSFERRNYPPPPHWVASDIDKPYHI